MRTALAGALLLVTAGPALSQTGTTIVTPPPAGSPAAVDDAAEAQLRQRIGQLPAVLAGRITYAEYFAPSFVAAVPEMQFKALIAQLVAAHGGVAGVEQVAPRGRHAADVQIGFERATASVQIVIDPRTPHKVTGLRVLGAQPRNDSVARLMADFAGLPGRHALLVRELGDTNPAPLVAINPDSAGPQGSTFKLWLLAEAARAVAAGERRWADVVPLTTDVPASIITGRWPATPMTLQAAATAMIAVSDNRATDTVLAALGRERVESMASRLGADPRGMPLLGTREAFAIKLDPARQARWCATGATRPQRAGLLEADARTIAAFDFANATQPAGPMAVECVEWFASPTAMTGAMDWLRREGSEVARGILSVGNGLTPATSARFRYVGYKGGSEPGVIAMTFLMQTPAGRWFAASGYWTDPTAAVDDQRFAMLMNRAAILIPTD